MQNEGREDQTTRMIPNIMNESRDEAVVRMKINQKEHALKATTNDLDLGFPQLWPFKYSDDEDLATAEENLEIFRSVVERKTEGEGERTESIHLMRL